MKRGRLDRVYPALIAVAGAQRLLELRISRRNERAAAGSLGTAAERTFPLMVALHVGLFLAPLVERRRRPPPSRAVIASAWAIVFAATGLRFWVIRSLGAGWNVRGSVPAGLRVVDGGPYRYVRHPNYVAVALEMAALPVAGGAWLSAVLLSIGNALVLVPRIRGEERLLDRVPGYAARMGSKPRFVPRIVIDRRTFKTPGRR